MATATVDLRCGGADRGGGARVPVGAGAAGHARRSGLADGRCAL